MTVTEPRVDPELPLAGRFWFARRVWPYFRSFALSVLPCPDLVSRWRMRRIASGLVTLRTWPGKQAVSADTAQLAMLRLLYLQRQTRRAVRGRHREASVMLARACVETLLVGLYCLRDVTAIEQLDAGALKGMADALAYLEDAEIAPAEIIRACIRRLGEPARRHVQPWDMVQAVDTANGNKAARDIHRRLYQPLSNFTVHAGGGTLMRHTGPGEAIRARPSKAWNRRSPARVGDAMTGLMGAVLAQHQGAPYAGLMTYSNRHMDRALMPVAFIGLSGIRSRASGRSLLKSLKILREVYDYLWHGRAAAESSAARESYLRERFAAMLDITGTDVPPGSLDPFIDHVAETLAQLAEPAACTDGQGLRRSADLRSRSWLRTGPLCSTSDGADYRCSRIGEAGHVCRCSQVSQVPAWPVADGADNGLSDPCDRCRAARRLPCARSSLASGHSWPATLALLGRPRSARCATRRRPLWLRTCSQPSFSR
jgi:hypothetical protein